MVRSRRRLTGPGGGLWTGSFDNFPSVAAALQGAWGVWVNTDGFTVGETKEIFAGIRIFELAKEAKTVRHYVWSNLDYSFKVRSRHSPPGFVLNCAERLTTSRKEATIELTGLNTTMGKDALPSG